MGHTGLVLNVAYSPDGRRVATASRDGAGRVYVIPTEDLVVLARANDGGVPEIPASGPVSRVRGVADHAVAVRVLLEGP